MKNLTNKNIVSLVSSELRYNLALLLGIAFLFAGYSIISIFEIQFFNRPPADVDFWGALFALFFYLLIYSMWMIRIKEKRLRLHSILPVQQRVNAFSRLMFILTIITASFVYITLQLIVIPSWSVETGGILAQLGFVFIVFTLVIIGRDLWFLHFNHFYSSINIGINIYIRPAFPLRNFRLVCRQSGLYYLGNIINGYNTIYIYKTETFFVIEDLCGS
jgi:hypothetical protein